MKKTRIEDLPTWQEIQEQERIQEERDRIQHTNEGFVNPATPSESYRIGIDPYKSQKEANLNIGKIMVFGTGGEEKINGKELMDMFLNPKSYSDSAKKLIDAIDMNLVNEMVDFAKEQKTERIALIGFSEQGARMILKDPNNKYYRINSVQDCRGFIFDREIVSPAFDEDKANEIVEYINKYCKV